VMVILGELDDHSEHSQVAHRNVGKEVADVADVLITLGGEAAQAARSAIDHGMDSSRVFTAYSWEEAVSFAQHYGMSENDIIYVKGGRLARMETVVRAQLADKSDEVYTVRYVPDEADKSTSPTQSLFPSWVPLFDKGAEIWTSMQSGIAVGTLNGMLNMPTVGQPSGVGHQLFDSHLAPWWKRLVIDHELHICEVR